MRGRVVTNVLWCAVKGTEDIPNAVYDCFSENEDYGLPSRSALVDLLIEMMQRIEKLEAAQKKPLTSHSLQRYGG